MPKSSAVRTTAAGLAGFAVRCGAARAPSALFGAERPRAELLTLLSIRMTGGAVAEGAAAASSGAGEGVLLVTTVAAAAAAMADFVAAGVASVPRDNIRAAATAATAPIAAKSGSRRLRNMGSGSKVLEYDSSSVVWMANVGPLEICAELNAPSDPDTRLMRPAELISA